MPIARQDTTRVPVPSAHTPQETILLVEDSKAEQHRMHAMLRGFGYRVLTADNGQQALDLLRREPIRLILSDWRMPKISGIELCRALREDFAFGQPYVILITGQNTKNDLIAGMDAGADDFIAKPFNGEELRVRVQAGVRLQELRGEAEQRGQQLAAALRRESAANETIHQDLAVAARMQRESLPSGTSPFPQLQLGALFRAATQVAGDSYDFFRLDDRHLGFYLIDVAGHGVAAAMVSFTVSRFVSPQTGAIALCRDANTDAAEARGPLASHIMPPDRVVHALNQRFVDGHDCEHYFTMVYGVLNVESGAGELCQAGHPYPLVVASGDQVRRLGTGGFPVGMLQQASYESVAFHLEAGERLVLYSDGITDCAAEDGKRLGERGLTDLLAAVHARPLGEGIEYIEQRLRHWQGGNAGEDDMSLLAIARLAAH